MKLDRETLLNDTALMILRTETEEMDMKTRIDSLLDILSSFETKVYNFYSEPTN
jgi:hypothetical protein